MQIKRLAAAAFTAAALVACRNERVAAPQAQGAVPVRSAFAQAAGGVKTYVVLGTGSVLPVNLAAAVRSAGGVLTATMPGIGVAVATSGDAGFATKLAKASGVAAVAEDVTLDFAPPKMTGAMDADAGVAPLPGQEAIGSLETYRLIQWAPDAIHAPEAWEAGYQGAGARVAVLDGGIYNLHADIAANLDVAHSTSFVPGQPYNYDVERQPDQTCSSTASQFWHGTHVAGLIAAPANNFGVVGIAPKATIIGVKVLHCGTGSFSWITQGIYYAATPIAAGGAGANIINMSLGALIDGRGTNIARLLDALSRATSYANHVGVTVIAAAGNDYTDLDHSGNMIAVPAQSVGVLAIAATGPVGWAFDTGDVDRPASYTNFGQSAIHFAAPGGDFVLPGNDVCAFTIKPSGTRYQYCWALDMVVGPIRGSSTPPYYSYGWAAGTSMASPMVAGVAALIIGKYGPLPPAQVEAILRRSADDLGKPGNDDYYGLGRVNAFRAVQ